MRGVVAVAVLGAGFLLGGCVAGGSGARQVSGTVYTVQNRPIRLASVVSLHEDCSPVGDSVIQVIQPPVNGTIAITRSLDYSNFPPANPRSACNKIKRPAVQATYKPNPGFLGADQVVLDTIFPTGGLVRGTSNIVVR